MMSLFIKLGLVASLSLVLCACGYTQQSSNEESLIFIQLRSGHYDQALHLIHNALKTDPQNPKLWTMQALAYVRSNQPEQALAAYNHALRLNPKYLPALEGAAEIEYSKSDKRSISLLHSILDIQPKDVTAHGMLAVMEYKSKNCKVAIEDFKLSRSGASSQPAILGEYGYCLAELGHSEEAIPLFEKALELQPNANNIRYDLALDQWMVNRPTNALATLQPSLSANDPDGHALKLAANIYESLGETQNAVQLLRSAIVHNPKDVDNYVDFATLSNNHKAYQVGIDMINAGLTQVPNSAQLYLARGILYSQLAEYDNAMADFEHANRIDPNLATAAEGLLQSQQHHLNAAIRKFRFAAKQRPKDAYAQYLLADALSQKSYIAGSVGYREEINAAKRAVQIDPTLTAAHDLLATLYLRSGEINLAIQHCQDALRQDPKDQQALYHLILALRKTDRRREIPALVKRLAKIRQTALTEQKQKKLYKFSDASAPPVPSEQ